MTNLLERAGDWCRTRIKFSLFKEIKQAGGFRKALMAEFKSKEIRTWLLVVIVVGLLCFIWGARTDCAQNGGLFVLTGRWGISWSCFNLTELEHPQWATPWSLNLSILNSS
jgi:hypothetical protein